MFKINMTANTEEPEKSAAQIRKGILDMMITFKPEPLPASTFIESDLALKREEDWSKCRSPSRAKRRSKMGHRQHVVIREVPCAFFIGDVCYCHPDIAKKIRDKIKTKVDSDLDRIFLSSLYGKF